MEPIVAITVIAAFQFIYFSQQVGRARARNKLKAPAISGNLDFERHFRVQQNTLEQLVLFFPGLWMFGHYVDPIAGAGVGLVFVIARFIYRAAYIAEKNRGLGFGLSTTVLFTLLLGGLVGAARTYFEQAGAP